MDVRTVLVSSIEQAQLDFRLLVIKTMDPIFDCVDGKGSFFPLGSFLRVVVIFRYVFQTCWPSSIVGMVCFLCMMTFHPHTVDSFVS